VSDPTAEGDRPASHDEEVLWKLYAHAVEEYRFQVNLNWQRLQYFLGLNLAILGVGAGLLRLGSEGDPDPNNLLPALVFLAGVGLSLAAWHLARKQQGYYRSARDRMTAIADQLGVADLGVATTAGARGESTSRWAKVRTVNEAVLAGLAVLNAIGAAFAWFE
jgi:hypothetical protein